MHLGVREIQAVFMKVVTKKEWKRKTVFDWCSIFHWQKARNRARPPEKSNIFSIGSYVWLFLLDFAQTDCLLKLYVNQISKNSFVWALLGNAGLHWAYFIWLAEGVATTPCCCAKLVFMLLTIGLWRRAGLFKLWVAASNGAAKCNFGISKPIGLTNQIEQFL